MSHYTDQEMTATMAALVANGKSILEILNDPKCKPDFKEKMQKLQQLKKRGGLS